MKPVLRVLYLLLFAGAFTTSSSYAADKKYENDALNLLKELVPYKTAAGYGQVIPMAKVLVDRFKAAGFAEEDISLIPMLEDTASLVVRLRGRDSTKKPVLFMGAFFVL